MTTAEPLVLQGLALAHYAAVKAAQAEGFADTDILAVEGVEPRRWARADPAWKVRLVDDPAAFAAYEVELAAAEDWLDRDVSPIDRDAAAWASFLSAFATGGAEILRAHGLLLSDVARLRRRWSRRSEQDPKLDARLAELRSSPPALPLLRVAPATLRPSRHARGRAADAGAAQPSSATAAEPSLSLDRYAALCAGIAERPEEAALALAGAGLSGEAALAELDGFWRREMNRDAALAADFRRLFAHNRARLSAQVRSPSGAEPPRPPAQEPAPLPAFHAAPPAIRAALRGTSLFLDVPRSAALPFQPSSAIRPAPPQASTTAPESPARGPLTGTSLALEAAPRVALPFGEQPTRVRPPLAVTAPALDRERGPALPFVPGEAPPAVSAGGQPSPRRAPAPLAVTAPLAHPPNERPLPFAPLPAAVPPRNKLGRASLSLDFKGAARPAEPRQEPSPSLTLEQYASLCVDISLSPGAEAETLARYQLAAEDKRALDGYYGARVARDPELRRAWDAAYRTYHAWVIGQRRRQPPSP